jgi:hypothetical protein
VDAQNIHTAGKSFRDSVSDSRLSNAGAGHDENGVVGAVPEHGADPVNGLTAARQKPV